MKSEERAYKFALEVIKFIDGLPNDMSTKVIARQLLRSATSIGANIAEAQASTSRRDFTNYFSHSLKSANETKYRLRLLKDAGKANKQKINSIFTEAEELSNVLGSSILTLKGRRKFYTLSSISEVEQCRTSAY